MEFGKGNARRGSGFFKLRTMKELVGVVEQWTLQVLGDAVQMSTKNENQKDQDESNASTQQPALNPSFVALLNFIGNCIAENIIVIKEGSQYGNKE